MSKHSERDTFPYAFVCVIFVLTLPIMIPICLLVIVALFIFKIKGIYCVVTSIVSMVTIYILNRIVFTDFFSQFTFNLKNNIQTVLSGKFPTIEDFLSYKGYSWFILFLISLLIGGMYKAKKEKSLQFEKAGIISLKKEVKEIAKQDDKLPKNGVYIGKSNNNKIYCPYDAKHIYTAGTTGSGKTIALSNFINSACEQGFPALLVDGKGDTGKDSMLEITKKLCNKYNRNLIVINMNNPTESVKYNPFAGVNATVASDMLISMSDWSEEHYKSNTKRYLQRLIKLMILNDDQLSYNSIIYNMSENNFYALNNKLSEENKITQEEFELNISICQEAGNIAKSSFSRFATLAEGEMGNLFGNDGINIISAIRDNNIILFVLNPLLYPDTSALMGKLVLIDCKQSVSQLFSTTNRKFFIFDEMNVYASDTLIDLVNKSRSAKVTCILATQSLADLDKVSSEFKQQVVENCNNYIIMRQNSPESASQWGETVGTQKSMGVTYQVNNDDEAESQKGSVRPIRQFIVHPDSIKLLKTGEAYYVTRDYGIVEKIKVNKPL